MWHPEHEQEVKAGYARFHSLKVHNLLKHCHKLESEDSSIWVYEAYIEIPMVVQSEKTSQHNTLDLVS